MDWEGLQSGQVISAADLDQVGLSPPEQPR